MAIAHTARPAIVKARIRAVVAILLLAAWIIAAATGFLLWLAPTGPRSGQIPLLLMLTKSAWGDIHFWVSVLASAITVVHITIDWRALCGCVRHLTSVHRDATLCG
ncbi:MAG: DUF4405 domain-containing protein [Chloroflexota bacterium]